MIIILAKNSHTLTQQINTKNLLYYLPETELLEDVANRQSLCSLAT